MKHIMAAIDGSETSYRALGHAAELAGRLGTTFTVLIVRLIVVGRKNVLSDPTSEEAVAIQDTLKDIVEAAGDPDTTVIIEKSQNVAAKIIDVAKDRGVDLIVMGASGKGGIKSFLLGSVSQEVLNNSACPVTIVR